MRDMTREILNHAHVSKLTLELSKSSRREPFLRPRRRSTSQVARPAQPDCKSKQVLQNPLGRHRNAIEGNTGKHIEGENLNDNHDKYMEDSC
jgi:hypothetical protein